MSPPQVKGQFLAGLGTQGTWYASPLPAHLCHSRKLGSPAPPGLLRLVSASAAVHRGLLSSALGMCASPPRSLLCGCSLGGCLQLACISAWVWGPAQAHGPWNKMVCERLLARVSGTVESDSGFTCCCFPPLSVLSLHTVLICEMRMMATTSHRCWGAHPGPYCSRFCRSTSVSVSHPLSLGLQYTAPCPAHGRPSVNGCGMSEPIPQGIIPVFDDL